MRCVDCKNYSYHGYEGEYCDVMEWVECAARPNLANLKQFPFKKTSCAEFDIKQTAVTEGNDK